MSKIVILKNQTYLSSKSIYHNLEGGRRVSLENALNHIYPVGSIFITTVNQDPSPYLGGKWQAFGAGRVLVGFDSSQTEFNVVKKTGGSKTVTLNINNIPNHSHEVKVAIDGGSDAGVRDRLMLNGWGASRWWSGTTQTTSTGSGQAHNNLQPYIVVYMFKRIS